MNFAVISPLRATALIGRGVFIDLIRRSVICTAERVEGEEPFFSEGGWVAIRAQLRDRHLGDVERPWRASIYQGPQPAD